MLTSPPQDGSSPLYAAAQNNHLAVVEVLIKHGAKVDLASDVSQCSQYSIPLLYYKSCTCSRIYTNSMSEKSQQFDTTKLNVQFVDCSIPFHIFNFSSFSK